MWDERKEKVMWQNDSLNNRVPSSEVKLYDCYANKIRKTILIISPRTIEKDKKKPRNLKWKINENLQVKDVLENDNAVNIQGDPWN